VTVLHARSGEPLVDALARAEKHELVGLDGETLEAPTRVALAWNVDALALRAWVESRPPLRVAVTAPNGPVWEDECVELFVSHPGEPARYVEVVVNPLGVGYAARVFNPDASRDTWTIARGVAIDGLRVHAEGDGPEAVRFTRWMATIELPWSACGGPPEPGDVRAANITRIGRGEAARFEALSPTLRSAPPDFHVPPRFARVIFQGALDSPRRTE
jgi:hypothetical protein